METLPENIKIKFYNLLLEKQCVLDFEKWVYESKELEKIIDGNSHLDFISLNYKANGAYYELRKLIEKQIDKIDFLEWKLVTELNNVKLKKGNFHLSIINFYELYCKGYEFIENLAFGYGLPLDCPYNSYGVESYGELNQQQRESIVSGFYPEILFEIDKVLDWINNKEIILKESSGEFQQLNYVDLRKEKDIKPATYTKDEGAELKKKWWKVW